MGATTNYIAKDKIRILAQRSNLWGFYLVFHVWATVAASVAMFAIWPSLFTFILAFLIIGSRQHGMAILMHDAAHGILFKDKKINDFIGQYVLASSYGADLHTYRKYHLKHHRYTQSDDDPDLPLSQKYPISKASLIRKVLRDITGMTYLRIKLAKFKMKHGGVKVEGSDSFAKKSDVPTLVTNVVIFSVFWATGHPWLYFSLWLLPLVTFFFVIIRLRNISEHALTDQGSNPLTHARTTRANWLARVFLSPYWVNYHVEHHAYMYVPCYRLKSLHKLMGQEGHHPYMEMKPNYFAVMKLAVVN